MDGLESARYVALSISEAPPVLETTAESLVTWSRENVDPALVLYSIRIPEMPGPVGCHHCGIRFHAAGPTGYADDEPICDLCLLESSHELGMVMGLIAVTRDFGVRPADSGEDYTEALAEFGAFARIYERFAALSGPRRIFEVPQGLSDA